MDAKTLSQQMREIYGDGMVHCSLCMIANKETKWMADALLAEKV